MLRYEEPGFQEICVPDPSARRGLWMKREPPLPAGSLSETDVVPTSIELCAGREGDDADVRFEVGDTVTPQQIAKLHDLILTVRYAYEHRDWDLDWLTPNAQLVATVIHNARADLLGCLRTMEAVRAGDMPTATEKAAAAAQVAACDAGFSDGRTQALRDVLPILAVAYKRGDHKTTMEALQNAWHLVEPSVRNEFIDMLHEARPKPETA